MAKATCSVDDEDCTPDSRIVLGLCVAHYTRQRRYGSTDDPRNPGKGLCEECGQHSDRLKRLLCEACYMRWYYVEKGRVQYYRDRYAEDPERSMRFTLAWRAANPERHRLSHRGHEAVRRARMAGNDAESVDYAAILAEFGMVCHLCQEPIEDGDLEFDHVIPVAHKGPTAQWNMRPSHKLCNRRKGAKLLP